MAKKPIFEYRNGKHTKTKKTYYVFVDGSAIGSVIYFWIRHLEIFGWEAIGLDGHRAVHSTQEKAARALIWDGKGYPFPYI
jgi:hypothetical protein